MDPKKYLAEAIGTFVLVGVGSMSIVAANTTGAPILAAVPFGFGIGLMAAIYAVGQVSGGHFNPAVTIAMVIDRRTTGVDAVGYIVAQLIGAVAAAALLLGFSGSEAVASTTTSPGPALTGTLNGSIGALVVETVMTAVFLVVILTVTKSGGARAGLLIALTLLAIHFAAIPFSGSSVNPARSLGPAIVSGTYTDIWVYIVGPILGGIIGWAVYRYLAPQPDTAA
jgi:aquaporin Z